jgi:hypothetical protein
MESSFKTEKYFIGQVPLPENNLHRINATIAIMS